MMLIYFGIFTLVCVAMFVVASLCRRKARRLSKLDRPFHDFSSRLMVDRMDSRSVKLDDRDRNVFAEDPHAILAEHLKKANLSPDDKQDIIAAERARRKFSLNDEEIEFDCEDGWYD